MTGVTGVNMMTLNLKSSRHPNPTKEYTRLNVVEEPVEGEVEVQDVSAVLPMVAVLDDLEVLQGELLGLSKDVEEGLGQALRIAHEEIHLTMMSLDGVP